MPIGNGRLGAMIFGKPQEEWLQLNEQTLWMHLPVHSPFVSIGYGSKTTFSVLKTCNKTKK